MIKRVAMQKEKILQIVAHAQSDIKKMVENAKLMRDGIDLKQDAITTSAKECLFGKWFYGEGQKLKTLSNNPMECLQNITLLHEELHKEYAEILRLYNEYNRKNGFLNIFSKKRELPKEEFDTLLQRVQKTYELLHTELVKMHRRIQATPQEKFETL